MFDDTLDDPVQTPESSVPSPTDGSRAMTNGSNGHSSEAQDLATPTDGIGSEKSEKARSSKLKAQADKSSGEKASNGHKSNGSKAAKSQKASAKSKPSKEKGLLDGPSAEPGHVPSSSVPDAPDREDLGNSSEDNEASSNDVLQTPPAQAASLPSPDSPISFSTIAPQNDGPEPVGNDGAKSFVRANLVTLVLGFVAVCLAVALVVTMLQLGNRNSQLASKNALEIARSSALAAARTYTVDIASYNYQNLDQDFAAVEANSTPSFQQSYSKSSSALKAILIRYKSSARATVLSAGVVSGTATRVVVVVFLVQTVTNTSLKTPSQTPSQISMNLVHSNGRWLIDNVIYI
jgi:Mce-associated membrane protein